MKLSVRTQSVSCGWGVHKIPDKLKGWGSSIYKHVIYSYMQFIMGGDHKILLSEMVEISEIMLLLLAYQNHILVYSRNL